MNETYKKLVESLSSIFIGYFFKKGLIKDNPNLKCPNSECDCNKKNTESSFKYIQYNADDMKYIYICNVCGQKWNN